MTSPQQLKTTISSGLLSFPLTDFDSEFRFAPKPYAERLEWLMPYGATALFAAGGTGEFFSLEPQEFSEVIRTAAELYAGTYQAMGCPVYSSAVFNFIPRTAIEFYDAHHAGDTAKTNRLIDEFFLPYVALRNQGEAYAVSIVKAGATLVGHSAGPVRPPLSDLKPQEVDVLGQLISRLGPQ